ncbi:DNA-directed RNA polymerase I subunit RPA34-like [Ptychodera flava]|uniref:DNA-directed RNA polymerase I subunit RPA34-like n=1 Tax=Ptychodera flava TaxID=63121 RepID=UPI00396A45EF
MSDQESSSSGSSRESESESEVEADSNEGPPPTQTKMKFDCPDDFAEVSYHDSSGPTVEDVGSGKELWLIRMPYNFDASKLNGQTVVLDGSQRILQEGDSDIAYEVQSSTTKLSETSNLNVLLPSKKSKRLAPAPPISGQMNIIQSIDIPPMKIPQPPAPKYTELPEGVKLRYKPFGSLTPTPSKADTSTQQQDDNLGRKSKRLQEENKEESVETEVDASKKKKKKKKKRKNTSTQQQDDNLQRKSKRLQERNKEELDDNLQRKSKRLQEQNKEESVETEVDASKKKKKKKRKNTSTQQQDDNLQRKSKRLQEQNKEEFVEKEVDASKEKKTKEENGKTEEREEAVVETQTPNLRKKSDRGRRRETVTEHSSTKTESPNTTKLNDLSKTNRGEQAAHPGRTKERSFDFTNIKCKEDISSSNNETDEVSNREKKKMKKGMKRKMTDERMNSLVSQRTRKVVSQALNPKHEDRQLQAITDATAAEIENALIEFLTRKEICDAAVDKIYGLGTDGAAPLRQRFCDARENYINKLLQNLDSRFPDDEMNILECFDLILNPHRYPENVANLPDYGSTSLINC